MDLIKNIEKNTSDMVSGLASLDINVDNTSVVNKLTDVITALNSLDVSTTLIIDPLVTVFNAQSFPKSPDSGYTANCTPIDVSLVKKLWLFCTNATSTNMTIIIYGHSASSSTDYVTLYTLTLSTTNTTGGCCIVNTPPYITIKVINNDIVNAGTVTVTMSKTR